MSNLKFNCPQCGQHLTVDAAGAGTTVACPNCGQAIIVPQLARAAVEPQPPKQMKWWWVGAGVAAVVFLAAGVLIWKMHRQSTAQMNSSAPAKTGVENPNLTTEMLQEKRFEFGWQTAKDKGSHGILTLNKDGTIGGSGSPNETFWLIDEKGRLIFKHKDGRVSTIFSNGSRRDGRWVFLGPFQFETGVEHSLKEVSPEEIAKEKWSKSFNNAIHELQNININDRDSAKFLSDILASLDRPGGTSPEALAADSDRINNKVRELVQHVALENAAILQDALYDIIYAESSIPPGPSNPPNPNLRTDGKPGPGGLVLYLPFDKPADADGTVHDESGAGNDGKVFGAQWVPDGKFGGTYQFQITNFTDRIVIPNSDTLNPDTITVSAWVKTPVNDGFYGRIVDKDCRNAYCLNLAGDWKRIARRGKSGQPGFETSRGLCYADRSMGDNQWHHIAATYDGRIVCFYLDGVKTSRQVRNPGPLKKSGWDLCIGNSIVDYGTGEFLAFDGLIDEVRIYNRALSAEEINLLATATHAGTNLISPEAISKSRRVKTLTGVLHNFQDNDPETAKLVSNIAASLDQPEGTSSNALAGDIEQLKNRVREMVRRGDTEGAAILNGAQANAFWSDTPSQPAAPSHKLGGTPGPGGLVLYLPFDKPAENGVVHDESGAGNDGKVFGAQWVPDSKLGGAYRFTLANFNDRIVIPNNDSLNPEHLTLSVWVKPAINYGFWRRILDKDCWHGYCLSLAGNKLNGGKELRGKPWFEGQVGTGSGRALDDNQWHHVAATFDGQTARCYIDGVEDGSRKMRNPSPLKPDDWDLCIGNSVPDFGGELVSFDGLIGEVRIYNRALSAAEIKSLATATHAGIDATSTPAGTPDKADPAERLKKLKGLLDQGLINKEDYDKKVKEIMDSL